MSKNNLTQSLAYRKFIADRDEALEDLHHRFLSETADQQRKTFHDVAAIAAYTYAQNLESGFAAIRAMVTYLDNRFEHEFDQLIKTLVALTTRHRKDVYLLSHVGEAEAIGRGFGEPAKYNTSKDEAHLRRESPAGGPLDVRFHYILNDLKRRLIQSVHRSAMWGNPPDEMLKQFNKKFPKVRKLPTRRRILKLVRMQEANTQDPTFSTGYLSDQDWADMVSRYLTDYVPDFRGPDAVLEMAGPAPTADDYYAWQLEQELTQDFVMQVRLGQIDAAKENGIEDFIWVAIVDDKTDDCCLWRDGLTSSEIEKELKKRKDDICQSIVPPAHYNCRCVLSPATEKTINAKVDVGIKDFEKWLDQP